MAIPTDTSLHQLAASSDKKSRPEGDALSTFGADLIQSLGEAIAM